MKCNQCNTEFEGKFCPNCGAPMEPIMQEQSVQNVKKENKGKKNKKVKKPFYKRVWFILLVVIIAIAVIASITGKNKGKGEKIAWSDIVMGNVIPKPSSNVAQIYINNDASLSMYIYGMKNTDYSDYVKKCEDMGFSVDVDKDNDSFKAYNSDGYKLSLRFLDYSDTYMDIDLDAPDEKETTSSDTSVNEKKENTSDETPKTPNNTDDELVDGMHKDFKEAMDNYEAFIDEYVKFMKKYSESDGTDASLLRDYTSYMTKYAETMESFGKWESEDMNSKETAYYIEVQTRVNQKLLEAAQ